MSLFTRVGSSLNVLDETPEHTRRFIFRNRCCLNSDLEKFKHFQDQGFECAVIQCVFKQMENPDDWKKV